MIYCKRLFLLTTLSLVLLLITGCDFRSTFNSANQLRKSDAKEYNIAKAVVEPFTEISIDTRLADIEILPADNFYVEISYLYWEEQPEYSIEDGILTFDDADSLPDSYSISFKLRNYIKVFFPEDAWLDLMDISTSSGDINAEGFQAEKAILGTSYGNLSVDGATAVKAEFVLSSGSSTIKDLTAGTINFTNSYGKADFTNINTEGITLPDGSAYDSFHATLSSGNCTIKGMKFDTIDITDSYGNITLDEITAETLDVNLSSGDLAITKSEVIETDVNNSYGDASLTMIGTEEDYRLDLATSYGDITVEQDTFDGHLQRDNNGSREISADLSSGDIKLSFID